MKYHIGIFGTQMNVCTLIEKNIIDFFSCKKIKPDIDIGIYLRWQRIT